MTGLEEGIKTVGIGKKGSKNLSEGLIQDILKQIPLKDTSDIQKGAFLGGLLMKGVSKEEEVLLKALDSGRMIEEAPEDIQELVQKLVQRDTLNVSEAYLVGKFLFSKEKGEAARGLIASILRVRYETPDEYEGLMRAMEGVFESPFLSEIPVGKPIFQIAEPFDGVTRSYVTSPLMPVLFQDQFRFVFQTGSSSGPKFGHTLRDIALHLEAPFLKSNHDLRDGAVFGCYLDQQDLSAAMGDWIQRRHQLLKRPFLATLERFVNPFRADVMLASAFHAPYGEKMMDICERVGFPYAIIVRNGLEGTTTFPLLRDTKVLASRKLDDGGYERKDFTFSPPDDFKIEEKLDQPSLDENARLIQTYAQVGKTDNAHFNVRLKYMRSSFNDIIQWSGVLNEYLG